VVAFLQVLHLGLQLRVDHPFHPSFEQTCLQDLEVLQLDHLVGMEILEGSLVVVHLLQLPEVLQGILVVVLQGILVVVLQGILVVDLLVLVLLVKLQKKLDLMMELSWLSSSVPVLASK